MRNGALRRGRPRGHGSGRGRNYLKTELEARRFGYDDRWAAVVSWLAANPKRRKAHALQDAKRDSEAIETRSVVFF
jgi:hypothetical protein